ncbi:MAG: galactose oxidase [Cyclobacteriaceae bacterium]|nr:galactose oxidase [Cyclobacteriaceae bacterium SS2]
MRFSILVFSVACLAIFTQCGQQSSNQSTQRSWEQIECNGTPHARHECSFVEVDGKFYLLGGRGIKPVDIFDPETKTWTQGAEPPLEVHHFQAVAYKGKVYVMGGMTGKYPHEDPIPQIVIYDPAQDQWSLGDSIPANRQRGGAGVVVSGNSAYILSGITDGHWEGHVKWVDQYNFETGEWSVLQDAPRARDHFHAALYDGKIYCAAGRNSSAKTEETFNLTIAEVDVYDLASNSWTTLPEDQNLPTERAGTTAIFLEDNLLVIGGESAAQETAHAEVEAYDVSEAKWTQLDMLERGRHGAQAILYDQSVFIAAGCGNRGGKPELDTIERY